MNQANGIEATPVDPHVIEAALDSVASLYVGQFNGCAKCVAAINKINAGLDDFGINATNARAFAHGVGAAHAVFSPTLKHVGVDDLKNAALLITESLRRSGDITDEQIEAARQRYRAEQGSEDPVTKAAMQRMEQAFGGVATAPSRGMN